MLRPLLLDEQIVREYLEKNDYTTLATFLKNTFKLERNSCGALFQYEFSKDVSDILLVVLKTILQFKFNDDLKELTRELFRSLRNYVINREVQNYLITNGDFLNDVSCVMNSLHTSGDRNVMQLILQSLINLIVSNDKGACKVFDIFSEQIFILLKEKHAVYETTALLYNISVHKSLSNELNLDRYTCIFELFEISKNVEFLQFLLDTFVSYDHFWDYYNDFNLRHRIITLEIIRHKQIENQKLGLPLKGIKVLTDYFVSSGTIIFQTVANNESNLEPYEVSQLLEVISSLCSNERYLKLIQTNKDLLINSGVLLINIHRLGKESENCFSSSQKLSEMRESNSDICQHPAFGFKADLIRIIGNLCWENKEMQDLVREAELIPVILDCCNMDARNPFIMQWVILAVRNLCKNNLKNQQIIAGMHQKGTVSSAALGEMGITLHSESDTSLKIVPLETLQKLK